MQWMSEKTPNRNMWLPFKVAREILLACLIKRVRKVWPLEESGAEKLGNKMRWKVTNGRSGFATRPFRAGGKGGWAVVKSSGPAWVHRNDTRLRGGLFTHPCAQDSFSQPPQIAAHTVPSLLSEMG